MESIPRKNTPVLLVDDDTGLLFSIKSLIVKAGMPEPAVVSDSRMVMQLVRENHFQLVLLDLKMPFIDGIEILKQIKEEFPEIECIILTAVDEVSKAVKSMKYGAYDYLLKPIDAERLLIVINRALDHYNLKHGLELFERSPSFSELKNKSAFKNMIAEDDTMARIFLQTEVVAPTDYSVFISGESGTGKRGPTAGLLRGEDHIRGIHLEHQSLRSVRRRTGQSHRWHAPQRDGHAQPERRTRF